MGSISINRMSFFRGHAAISYNALLNKLPKSTIPECHKTQSHVRPLK